MSLEQGRDGEVPHRGELTFLYFCFHLALQKRLMLLAGERSKLFIGYLPLLLAYRITRVTTEQVMRSSKTARPIATKRQDFFPGFVDFSTISIWLSDFPIIVTLN